MQTLLVSALAFLCLSYPAQAQYWQPGPRIDPATGYRYYYPERSARGRQYFLPPPGWYGPRAPSYEPYRHHYLPRIDCYRNPFACRGPS